MSSNPESAPGKSKDEWQRLLREALKKRRPRWLRALPLLCLVGLALLLFVLWLLSPPREPPLIAVVALDGLALADAEGVLQGVLEIQSEERASLANKEMVFSDGPDAIASGRNVKTVAVQTDRHGAVSASWRLPAGAGEATFILKQIGNKFRPEDRGRVFITTRATRLCLVQIDGALTPNKAEDWRPEEIQKLAIAPGCAAALHEARKRGFAIVYLAVAAERPTVYQFIREWLQLRFADPAEPLPPGAVLSRFNLPHEEQSSNPYQRLAEQLRDKFSSGKKNEPVGHVAITGTLEAAKGLQAAGVPTLFLGSDEVLPAGTRRVADWEAARKAFEE